MSSDQRSRGQATRTNAPLVKAGAKIQEHHLKNGMQVIVAERHLDPVVAVVMAYKVGARNEREFEAGVSHFLEHMMFKGSERFAKGEIDLITKVLGGSNNAFTSSDHTVYWFAFASDCWEKALEIEADRMRGLLLDRKEFESEKSVVLEELSMGKDDPWRSLAQEAQSLLFGRHPYSRPVIGYTDTLEALEVSDMRSYYDSFYQPGNATLVVCGDVQPKRVLTAARKHFSGIPRGTALSEADCYRPKLAEPEGERRLKVSWDDPARRVCMGWPTASVGSEDDYRLDLLSAILSSGRLSRLQRRLVLDEVLAISITTYNDARVDGGAFWLYAECAQSVSPEKLEARIDSELQLLREEPINAAELKRAKAMLLANEAYHSETVSDLAEDLGSFGVDADWRLVVEGAERHQSVRARDLSECARRLLTDERRVVAWSLPRAAQQQQEQARRPTVKRRGRKAARAPRGKA